MPDDKHKVSKQFQPDVCGKETDYKSINECTDNWLYKDKFESYFKNKCQGNNDCKINVNDFVSENN